MNKPIDHQLHITPGTGKSTDILIPASWEKQYADLVGYLMELKRNNRRQGRLRSRLFAAIGLCLSLLIVITAFEWKFFTNEAMVELGTLDAEFEEIMEIPITEQPPPPPPKANIATIVEVPDVVEIEDEIEVNLDVEITEETVIEEVIYTEHEVQEEVAEEIFQFVEQQPEPPGGLKAFYKFIGDNLTYPPQARRAQVQGKVYIQFVINKDGSIGDIEILKGLGFGCDQEAIRVLEMSPKWNPGKQRGQPVRVRMSLPIVFQLQDV